MRSLKSLLHLFVLIASANCLTFAQARTGRDEPAFKISIPLEFRGRTISGSLRKGDVAKLLDLPVRNGSSDLKEGYGVEMTRPNGEKVVAYTCRQWKKAQDEKAYSATTYDMAMEGTLVHTCGLLFSLQNATRPSKSFVTEVTLADVKLLPAEILSTNSEDKEEARRTLLGQTISQVVAETDIAEAKGTILRLSFGGFEQRFEEAARADFDGEGREEIFVFMGGRVVDGTLGYSDNLILTRADPTGPLKLVHIKNADE